MMPPRFERKKEERPKHLREYPRYIAKNISGFFHRLFYIIRQVWETRPIILIGMALLCLLNGLLPVFGAHVGKEILNNIVIAINADIGDATLASYLRDTITSYGLVFWLLMEFLYLFLSRVFGRLNTLINAIAGELVTNHIKLKIMNKAKTVDLASFDRPSFYEKLENANREVGMRPISILSATLNVISTAITIVSFVVILISLHPAAPILIAVLALPGALVNYVFRNKNYWYIRHRSKERRQMQYFSSLVTDKDKAKELRIMGLSDTFIGNYKSVFKRYFAGLKRIIIKESIWSLSVSMLTLLANALLFFYVAYQVIARGNVNEIGNYSYYTGALTSITAGVSTLIASTATIYEGTLFIDNMITFMKEEPTVIPLLEEPIKPTRHVPHTIEFKNVSFRYPGAEKDVIHNVDLKFSAGDTVVLVGLNGAGKTTLIKLLTRLYDPTKGQILLDGVDLRNYDVKELYDIFGIIFQDFGKYAVSVRENIMYGDVRKEMNEEEIKKAALGSSADGFIQNLPDGYDTPLMRFFEENGTELSIGQWQKLSIARAFYKDSDILILDEPTASLDPMAEQEIFNQFAELGREKITIFVSHRLSSATIADQIVVLENGEVVENGKHIDLMHLKGKYYQLFTTQAKRYIENAEQQDEADSSSLL